MAGVSGDGGGLLLRDAALRAAAQSRELVFAIACRRVDISRDGARGGAGHRGWITGWLYRREERSVTGALAAGRNRYSGGAAVDQLHGLHLVTVLLLAYRDRDVLPNLVGRATLGGAEAVGGVCIENVALLADVDPGLEVRDLEMIMTLLD